MLWGLSWTLYFAENDFEFGSSWLTLQSAEIIGVNQHNPFTWPWGWNSGPHQCHTNTLPEKLHPYLLDEHLTVCWNSGTQVSLCIASPLKATSAHSCLWHAWGSSAVSSPTLWFPEQEAFLEAISFVSPGDSSYFKHQFYFFYICSKFNFPSALMSL